MKNIFKEAHAQMQRILHEKPILEDFDKGKSQIFKFLSLLF